MTRSEIDTPDGIPKDVAATLEGCSDAELREIVHYAQQLLDAHPPLTDAIESRPGEDLLRVEDHGTYTIAVVERPDERGDARGPFAYRVTWEPEGDDGAGQYRWHYLGKVYGKSEEG
ncbi:hypothetical protein [Halolamina salina]|uniref:Uncharacterized protein n=1 Tax=Halolamina salina TaxID=1220023 RepID=A0ABD6B3S2_9EURY